MLSAWAKFGEVNVKCIGKILVKLMSSIFLGGVLGLLKAQRDYH